MTDKGEVSPETEAWAAARVVAMHREGRCARCTRDGCRLYRWADVLLDTRREQGLPIPAVKVPATALTYRQRS